MKLIAQYTTVLFTVIFLSGCNKFMEVGVPKDQLDQVKAFNDDRTATAALTYAYTALNTNGFLSGGSGGISLLLGSFTDELEIVSQSDVPYKYFYEGGLVSTNTGIATLWNATYTQVYLVNNVLEGLEISNGVTNTVKTQLKGEALAIRGFLHFYLCQTFGNVPYINTTDYIQNKAISKESVDAVMAKALTDLEDAEKLLTNNYPTAERVRINKMAVQAMLARVHLYLKNWDKALAYAKTVIAHPSYTLENLASVFLRQSQSAILQFSPLNDNRNTDQAQTFIFLSVPPPLGIKLSPFLLQSFETDDQRKTEWTNYLGGVENSYAYKYKTRGYTTPVKEYSVIVRIQEMYLISAEAYAEMEDWDNCNNMLNAIRGKAGLTSIEVDNINDAIDAILKERRAELFCEFGHRYYDLKRRNRLSDLLAAKPGWKTYFNLLPLPENELLLNPKLLPQNTGY